MHLAMFVRKVIFDKKEKVIIDKKVLSVNKQLSHTQKMNLS